MPAYTIYSKVTGEIDATGACSDRDFDQAAFKAVYERQDKGVWLGEQLDHEAFLFVDGQPIARSMPYRPSDAELAMGINRERQRRIEAGKTFGGIAVTGRGVDRANLSDLALGAMMRLAAGSEETTLFRDGNNVDHELSPTEVVALWQQSAAFVSALYAASWALKAMTPIPLDFSDNNHWEAA